MLRNLAIVVGLFAALSGCVSHAGKPQIDTLQGAARALDALGPLPQTLSPATHESGRYNDSKSEPDLSTARALLARIDRYAEEERRGNNAAHEWFALYDAFRVVAKDALGSVADPRVGHMLSMLSLIAVLPEPAHWAPMRQEAQRRSVRVQPSKDAGVSALAMVLLFDTLLNDTAAQARTLVALNNAVATASKERRDQAQPLIAEWRKHLSEEAGRYDPVAELKRELDGTDPDDRQCCFLVASLIDESDERRARKFLEHALFQRRIELAFVSHDGTIALAQKIASANPQRLARVQWGLAEGPRALEFFYAMAALAECRRSGCSKIVPGTDFDRALALAPRRVRRGLLKPLILAKEDERAERLLLEASDTEIGAFELTEIIQSMVNDGQGQRAFDFVRSFLVEHPKTAYWRSLNAFAYSTDQRLAQQAYVLLAKAPHDTIGLEQTRTQLNGSIVSEPGVDEEFAATAQRLQQRLALPVAKNTENFFDTDPRLSRSEAAIQLAELGLLEHREEWLNEGLIAVESALGETRAAANGRERYDGTYDRNRMLTAVVRLLHDSGRVTRAEQLLFDELAAIGATCRATDLAGCHDRFTDIYSGAAIDAAPRLLVALYADAGRDADVRIFADRYPLWPHADATNLQTDMGFPDLEHPAIAIARSLLVGGETTRAANLLRAMLGGYGATPDAARLYGRVAGGEAIEMSLQNYRQKPGPRLAIAALVAAGAGESQRSQELAFAARREQLYPPWRGAMDEVLADAAKSAGDEAAATRWHEAAKGQLLALLAIRYEQAGITSKAEALYQQAIAKAQPGDCIGTQTLSLARKRGNHAEVAAQLRRIATNARTDETGGATGCLKEYLDLQTEDYAILRPALVETTKPVASAFAKDLPYLLYTLDADCNLSTSVNRSRSCVDAPQLNADAQAAYANLKKQMQLERDNVDALSTLESLTRHSTFASLYSGHLDRGRPDAPAVVVGAKERDAWVIGVARLDSSGLPKGIERTRDDSDSFWRPVIDLAEYWNAAFEGARHLPEDSPTPAYLLAASRDYAERSLTAESASLREFEKAQSPSSPTPRDPAIRANLAVGSTEIVMMAVRLIEPDAHDPCVMCT